jgi:LAO/AO transport system kinase
LNRERLSIQQYKEGILKSDRIMLAKAITLVESSIAEDQEMATNLIDSILEFTGNSVRIGITGVPGVGKSTFIEAFGQHLTAENKKIAILTIDPSSQLTKGSILGDKTRMDELSKNKLAFIRPSSAGEALGGVGSRTRESILLCEAAGYEVIMVETVGVGQSEVTVKNMVDFFLLLMLAGAGDELQGIKKGIMEMADAIVITKADGDNIKHATEARAEYQQALHLHHSRSSGLIPKVLTCSAINNTGIIEIWKTISDYKTKTEASGFFDRNRVKQNISWFHHHFNHLLKSDLLNFEKLKQETEKLEQEISEQEISPNSAARSLLEAYHRVIRMGARS